MEPWMNSKEIDMVIKYLSKKKSKSMIEWGSGGSTSLFSKYVDTYYSVEHNLDWYYEVRKTLVENDINNVVHHLQDRPKGFFQIYESFFNKWEDLILQVSEEVNNNYHGLSKYPDPKGMYIFYDYVNVIDTFPETHYDFIFIDGRSRVNCAYKALNYIDSNSIVFIHDFFNRPEYNVIFNYYDEIDSVRDTQQTIIALRKK